MISIWCPHCKIFGQPPLKIQEADIINDTMLSPWDKQLLLKEIKEKNIPSAKPSDGNCPLCGQSMQVMES